MDSGKWIRWWPLLRHEAGLKLLALVLALLAWLGIQETINKETVLSDVPVTVLVGEGWAVLDQSTDVVDLHLKGALSDLARLSRDQLTVTLDTAGLAEKGDLVLAVDARHVNLPPGVRLAFARPGRISVGLDREGEQTFAVKAEVRGSLPDGFDVERIVCVPPMVAVRAAQQRLAGIETVRTESIDLSRRERSFRERVALSPPSDLWAAAIDPEKITVEVIIVERSATRSIEGIPVMVMADPLEALVVTPRPGTIRVTLKGRQQALDRLEPSDVHAYVLASGLNASGRYELPVRFRLPEGVSVEEASPAAVTATVSPR